MYTLFGLFLPLPPFLTLFPPSTCNREGEMKNLSKLLPSWNVFPMVQNDDYHINNNEINHVLNVKYAGAIWNVLHG
jgi:hypothetical protein